VSALASSAASVRQPKPSLRLRLAASGIDGVTLLLLPAALFVVALFIYPFIYGFVLSFQPKQGGMFANYQRFFSDPFFANTIWTTMKIALPVTLLNLALALPIAFRVRLLTVLVAEGMLFYFGPQGWFNRTLLMLGLISQPVRLVHNYWGVLISLVITGFPFTFLLTLSYITGIDPSLEQAAATLGATSAARFRHIFWPLLLPGLAITFCLSFVQAYSVFPSAVLVGEPAAATRVISIAGYQSAFEDYDYAMASAIAMIMAGTQLVVVLIVFAGRALVYRGPVASGKG
jgi:putative spermidine/putrescine transport system permease protein